MNNYFIGTKENPYHLSIGGVLKNAEGKICCHYFDHISHPAFGAYDNFYLLMRETIEPGESIEQCLHRGLSEEFGATAELKSYLGSIVSHFENMVWGWKKLLSIFSAILFLSTNQSATMIRRGKVNCAGLHRQN